jgi:chromosome segregation ATPase
METETAEPGLERLQAMVQKVLEILREHGNELDGISGRLSRVEFGLAALRREVASDTESIAHTHERIDRLDRRIERIERRLDFKDS